MRTPETVADQSSARKVLLAVGSAGLEQRTLDYACELCRRIGADMDVLWLQEDAEPPPLLRAFVQRQQAGRIACRLLQRPGNLSRQVAEQVARDHRIAAVVMSAMEEEEKTWWSSLPCPLVVVKPVVSDKTQEIA